MNKKVNCIYSSTLFLHSMQIFCSLNLIFSHFLLQNCKTFCQCLKHTHKHLDASQESESNGSSHNNTFSKSTSSSMACQCIYYQKGSVIKSPAVAQVVVGCSLYVRLQ